jgi:sugar lactone lactonase YvrE
VIVKDSLGNFVGATLLHGIGLAPEAVVYPGIISTFAGTGMLGFAGDGLLPTSARLGNPQGVAADSIGNVYIADSLNQVVRKVSALTGRISTVAGMPFLSGKSGDGGQATQALLNNPTAVAVDGAGNLYIADQGNNRIRKLTAASGVINTVAGGGQLRSGADGFGDGGLATLAILAGPVDIAVDGAGNLYIADAFHGMIRKVDAASGVITAVAGGGISAGADGLGDQGPAIEARLNNPCGVAVDASGNLYIADAGNNLVRFVNAASGVISVIAGDGYPGYNGDLGPAVNAELRNPTGVEVDAAGNIYIADSGNNAIRQVAAASKAINTIAGSGAMDYRGDGGIPTDANLASPSGLALDSGGNLYIADNANNVIRKVTFQGSAMSFGTTKIGQASSPQLLTVENIGNRTLDFSAIGVSANFRQQTSGYVDCAASTGIVAGASCVVSLAFVPTTTFSLTGSATITTDSLNTSGSSTIATLSGTGAFGPVPKVALSAANLTFGNQPIGIASTLAPIVLTNSGNAPLGISNIWVSGANSAEFAVATTCGAALAVGASCSVTVTFTPAATGSRSAALIFNDSVANSPQTVGLSGNGVLAGSGSPVPGTGAGSPQVVLSPGSVNFGVQKIGTTNSRSVSVTNGGTAGLSISNIAVIGSNAAAFSIANDTCATSLAVGQSCTLSLTFSPLSAGNQTAWISISGSIPGGTASVPLSGIGTAAAGMRILSQADFGVWRPGNGTWYIRSGSGATAVQQWGLPGDIPVPGDYDGDGKTDFAVWRPSNGTWFIISSRDGGTIVQQWGLRGDIPVPADYDGDGKTDFAVWRPSNGTWFIIPSRGGATIVQQWGLPGDIPEPGDYDGDGKTDFAVFRPGNGTWFVIPSHGGNPLVQQWGLPGDMPIPGDYDGDGKTDFAVWRPAIGTWFVILSGSPGSLLIQQWGLKGDKPITRDFNGDGKSDLAVWRPANGTWYVLTVDALGSYPQPTIAQQWGLPGDIPL